MVSGQPVVAKKKIFFFGKSFLYIKRNILSHRASLYLAPRVRMRRASRAGRGALEAIGDRNEQQEVDQRPSVLPSKPTRGICPKTDIFDLEAFKVIQALWGHHD